MVRFLKTKSASAIFIIIVLLAACKSNTQQEDNDQSENMTTIDGMDSLYGIWGKVDARSFDNASDLPDIPNLYHNTAMGYCEADTCWAERLLLALRCPEEEVLLQWMEQHVNKACHESLNGYQFAEKEPLPHLSHIKNAKQICDHYVRETKLRYDSKPCNMNSEEHGVPLEQNGIIITDVWQKGDICTFFESRWFDFLSCGDNTRKSYYSVDRKTGKVLGVKDLIEIPDTSALGTLIYEQLGEIPLESHEELVSKMDGCALIKEGLIIYYHPYHLGCGASGHFLALIPYEELEQHGMRLKR